MTTSSAQTSAHTPGPWTHEDGEILAQGAVIAQVMGADDFPCCEEDIDAECKANARLIAAAPELLAALEAGILAMTGRARIDWANKARDLIAKARKS